MRLRATKKALSYVEFNEVDAIKSNPFDQAVFSAGKTAGVLVSSSYSFQYISMQNI